MLQGAVPTTAAFSLLAWLPWGSSSSAPPLEAADYTSQAAAQCPVPGARLRDVQARPLWFVTLPLNTFTDLVCSIVHLPLQSFPMHRSCVHLQRFSIVCHKADSLTVSTKNWCIFLRNETCLIGFNETKTILLDTFASSASCSCSSAYGHPCCLRILVFRWQPAACVHNGATVT